MDYRQVGQKEDSYNGQIFSNPDIISSEEDSRVNQAVNQKQSLSGEAYRAYGNQAIETMREASYQKSPNSPQVLDFTDQNRIELTMPPVAEQISGETQKTETTNFMSGDISVVKTGEKIDKEAIVLIEKKNRELDNGTISPDQFYDDVRSGLMRANLKNSYGRDIAE